ncbi:sulfatase [Isosphaeraceae bacterium EP7]
MESPLRTTMLLGLSALSLAFGLPAARAAEVKKPLNVLFILSDDLRPELGTYGHPVVKTPNIDALAASGVRFDRAYCQYPLCNPSRTSMLNGRYPVTTGVVGNRSWVGKDHPEFVSLPKYFKQQGYTTLRSGKVFHGGIDDYEAWTEGGDPKTTPGVDRGGPQAANPPAETSKSQIREAAKASDQRRDRRSDSIIVIPGDGDDVGDGRVANRAIQMLGENKDGPFFLACGFSKPHSPPEAPQRFFDLYSTDQVVLPPDFASRPTPPPGIPAASVRANSDLFIGRDASEQEAREVTRAYWASLSWMDYNVGRVIAELDRLGLRENTVIVFWGDHGYHLGEKGRWSKAGSLFETGARIPFIVVAPGAAGNGRPAPRVVQALDIYPTLVDLAGLPPVEGLQGRSLTPLLANPNTAWDHPAYTVWAETGVINGATVRNERYRYAEWTGPKGGPILFDLANDPHELKNLADDPAHAEVRKELSQLLHEHLKLGKK